MSRDIVQELADRLAIADVMTRYGRGFDIPDFGMIASCFTEDCRFEIDGHVVVGRDQIVPTPESLRELRKRSYRLDMVDKCTHTASDVVVELDGERAHVDSALTGYMIGSRDGEPVMVVRNVRHDDDMVRQDGSWLIATRRHELGWVFETTPVRW
jgi:SnoaL-like domain